MITDYDRKILTEVGREYILNIALDSQHLKNKLSFKEHVLLCSQINRLSYEEVISLTITEDIRAFEGKFGKFLKYSIAAIAGMKFIGALSGPPVAMFILYLYRKATDTCVRSCFTKMPLSKQRKICKYECQLNAAKKMTAEIRSEITKCSQFELADKCEKKLQGEYIKWAKRVQQLTIKLQRAKVDVEEKARKARQKQLAKKAKSLRAGLELSKDQLINFVSENENLRYKLPFREHLKLYQLCTYIQEEEVAPFKIDPKKEKMIRKVMYLGLWVLPIPFFNDIINYMAKKYSFGCAGKCIKGAKYSKKLCYQQCAYLGAKYAVQTLNSQISKCDKAKKPTKCKKKILNLLEDWKQREAERKIKFEATLRSEVRKAKAKNLRNQ
jgi:hypothetical protein